MSMLVKIVRATVANKQAVEPGQVVEVSDADGRYLCRIGKATPATAEAGRKARPERAATGPAENTTDRG